MLIKAASLSRNFLVNRSASLLSSPRTFQTKTSILKTKTNLIDVSGKALANQMHTSCCYFQSDPTSKSPQKPAFSPELQEILNSSQKKQQPSEAGSGEHSSDNKEEPKEEEKKGIARAFSREHGWKTSLALFSGIFVGASIYTLFSWGAPSLDENGKPIKDEYSALPAYSQYPLRAYNAVCNYYTAMKEPSTDKLLPEPLQYPYLQPTYTLVIEMTGMLLHPEWTFNTGWRYKKRPGLDYFLDQIKYPTFEVVLFTREPFLSGHPIVTNLDPQNQIQFRLFRESTNLKNNHYVKDLSFMNRDPSKIIVIDWDEHAYEAQPRNALHRLKKWEGDEQDTDLVYLASFLKMIATSNVSDVREVLDHYNKEIDPLDTFKLNQVRLKEAEAQRQHEMEEMKKSNKNKPAKFSFFKR